MHFGEVLIHRLGQEIAHIVSLPDLLAYIGGGYVYLRHIDYGHMGVRGQFAIGVSRPRVDIYLIVLENKLPVTPALEGVKVVGPHDEAELFVAVLVTEMRQSKDCVRRNGQVEFHVTGTHAVVVVHGQTHHLQPLLVGKEAFALLEWVLGRYHIPHLIEVAVGQHGVADDEMAYMDGIKRAEEKSDFTHVDVGKNVRHERHASRSLLIVLVTADDLDVAQFVAFECVDFTHFGSTGDDL